MEWRQQSAVSCELAFQEAQRWLEEVTNKRFGSKSFRVALEDGVLLCDLINKLKPGIIKRLNRLSTPIAGLDNVNVFLKACEKLGLNEAQLFHPGDLQDVSTRVTVRREETSRRLKNVLITIYWLGRKAQSDPFYTGPQLNLKAFEGLLGIALSKALEESVQSKSCVRDSGYVEGWFSDREDLFSLKQSGYRREDSVESLDSVEFRTLIRAGSEGCFSDAEAEHCFRMAEGSKSDAPIRERVHVPSALRRKRQEYQQGDRSYAGHLTSESGRVLGHNLPPASAFLHWASSYQSDSDSDTDHPEPDLVQDDLASRRFRSVTSMAPVNFAIPSKPSGPRVATMVTPSARKSWLTFSDASRLAAVPPHKSNQSAPSIPSENGSPECESATLEEEFLQRSLNNGMSDSDEDRGCADPVLDDLYTRRVLISEHQTSINADSDRFLPKYWTPEEALHVKKIRLGSQRRPWYKKMQGFRSKSMGDIPLEPIPQESDNCSSFDPLGSRHVHQRSVGELTLEPSAIQRVQQEQLQNMRARMKESEAKWHEDLSKWKSRRRSTNSDLHRKREEREQNELISGGETSAIRTAQLTGGPEESSNMPGPMSDAGSSVSSARLTGWSTTSASPLTNGTSSLTTGTDIETPDSAHMCTGEFFNPPAAVVSEPYEQQGPDFSRRNSFLESFYAGGARISATLPRGFRRSEGCSRLSTGITPRLFGAKPSKVSSLPKVYSIDDSHESLISGHRDYSIIPSFLSGQGKVTASAETGHSHSSTHPINPKKADEDWRDGRSSAPPMNSFVTKVTMAASMIQTSSPVVSKIREIKVGQSEMRVCLNQKANSGRDFGFKAHWDSTGACVKSVQAGSPAELCGLLMGDEIVALGGCRVAEMNYEQFMGSMDSAQQKGTLLMDIRRHGQNDWGSGHPSLPYKSHKTINLTSANSTLIGRPEHYVSISTTSNSPVETLVKTQVNGQPANKALTKMMNGHIQDNPVALRNKGGSESAISDLQVPSISSSSSRWSWDHEEERRRQEKWQMEQERLLQEKCRRDQEKLEEEWRRAQEEFFREEYGGPEEQKGLAVMSNGNTTSHIPPPIATTSVASNQIAEKVGAEQNRQAAVQIAAGHQSLTKEVECDSTTKSQCSEESYGFAKLTVSDRTKSKSTPALESLHKHDAKAAGSGKKKGQLSQAEKERLQILEEMRKKTQLLTDGSWIRQRNASINKESITAGASIKRYESLENLHSTSSWSRQSYTSGITNRPHSALGSTGSYRSGRSSLGPGSAIFSTGLKQSSLSASNFHTQPITTTPEPSIPESRSNSQQCGRLLSGRRMCSRCEQPLGKGAAMVIDSLELCFHIGCFKCVSCRTDLGRGIESGAQVRVRHRQLFCNNCYSRIRVCPSFSK
ncbi:LIM domain only protein 7b isoform X24 [Siphateles boraxobius]|uniref:LIM domain only protein 7b isoform X24 n=1 Tax=Siphateles boraxobius TaxID=180520 RepID=UPI004063475C